MTRVPAHVMAAVTEMVSHELDEDFVELWSLPWYIRSMWPEASDEDVRVVSEAILKDLLSRDVLLGDLDGGTGEFLPWRLENPVGVAMHMWAELGRDPTIGEIAWLDRVARNGAE